MAMTLRLTHEQDRALSLLAHMHGTSKHEAAVRAIVSTAARALADAHVNDLAHAHIDEISRTYERLKDRPTHARSK
ncbi:CopG family transcriptional regulator [Corynebacterium sp. sy039]|uniref:CopG family transcriptional regulator n=1 Tax=Corynebacterium sp. sy039 TaxID=2599641 RepID=UPI0011B82154|nr:CopG family transcriptional regulator [Corynebacterium sp. sy039]QDZ41733.1 CopG family transcriptional regulator [Corynebacterium sp. sy039]